MCSSHKPNAKCKNKYYASESPPTKMVGSLVYFLKKRCDKYN